MSCKSGRLSAFEEAHGPWGLPSMLALVAVFPGSAMPVAQITMQSQAPSNVLGAASASVQLSRPVGSAIGVIIAVEVLFVTLGRQSGIADAFADAVRHGPAALASLPEAQRAMAQVHIANSFSAAFLAITIFAAVNATLAWTLPLRRL